MQTKTETRRLITNKRIYKVGSKQPIQENYFDKAKGHVRILNMWTEKLSDMKPENVKAEGFESHYEYMLYLQKINKKAKIDIDLEVRAYRFKYIPPHPLNTCPQCSLFNYACSCDSGRKSNK
jgi:hypothetical protein